MEAKQEEMLNKKLAEWAGFKLEWFKSGGDFYATYPDGSKDTIPNFIQSLDACFKWLMPRLIMTELRYKLGKYLVYLRSKRYVTTGEAASPALALCLAIEKLIDKGVKGGSQRYNNDEG